MDFNEWLAKQGFDATTLTDTQRASLQAAWRASQNPAPSPEAGNAGFDALMGKLRAEQTREAKITALVGEAAQANPARLEELEAVGREAIAGKWSEERTELALLRTCRASAPSPLRGHSSQITAKVIEAAFAQHTGLENVEQAYDDQTLQTAHSTFRGGLGLQQLLALAAQANGYRSSRLRKNSLFKRFGSR